MKNSEIFIRDPFILPRDGKYYLYGTRSEEAFTKKATGLDVYVGTDLENWKGPKECFRAPEGFWATMNYWAPEVHEYQGSFYMFATFSDGKRKGTAILKADAPEGPFLPWSDGTITPRDWQCLDGTFYLAKDGTPYMVFCHEWKQVHDGTVCAVKLSEDLSKPEGKPFTLFSASQGKPKVQPLLFRNYVTDGPFLFRTEDGRLHMLWSSYGKGHSYIQALAHSSNDDIDGTWTVDRDLLFEKDGGHGMIFRSYGGRLMLALHSPNRTNREHPVLKPLTYADGRFRI